jgi:hypothetical protein
MLVDMLYWLSYCPLLLLLTRFSWNNYAWSLQARCTVHALCMVHQLTLQAEWPNHFVKDRHLYSLSLTETHNQNIDNNQHESMNTTAKQYKSKDVCHDNSIPEGEIAADLKSQ